jgi:hypothetical protein
MTSNSEIQGFVIDAQGFVTAVRAALERPFSCGNFKKSENIFEFSPKLQ